MKYVIVSQSERRMEIVKIWRLTSYKHGGKISLRKHVSKKIIELQISQNGKFHFPEGEGGNRCVKKEREKEVLKVNLEKVSKRC